MFSYNNKPITLEDIEKHATVKFSVIHYSKDKVFNIPKDIDEKEYREIALELKAIANILIITLSKISSRLHRYQNGDETLKYFIETGWKSTIVTNITGLNFVFPEQFTQQFIDSKEGKRFKDKKPCAHMFMRALQSQKTIMEQLQAVEV